MMQPVVLPICSPTNMRSPTNEAPTPSKKPVASSRAFRLALSKSDVAAVPTHPLPFPMQLVALPTLPICSPTNRRSPTNEASTPSKKSSLSSRASRLALSRSAVAAVPTRPLSFPPIQRSHDARTSTVLLPTSPLKSPRRLPPLPLTTNTDNTESKEELKVPSSSSSSRRVLRQSSAPPISDSDALYQEYWRQNELLTSLAGEKPFDEDAYLAKFKQVEESRQAYRQAEKKLLQFPPLAIPPMIL